MVRHLVTSETYCDTRTRALSTGAFNGCEKDQETFWFSAFLILKRHTVLLQQKGCIILNWYVEGAAFFNKR